MAEETEAQPLQPALDGRDRVPGGTSEEAQAAPEAEPAPSALPGRASSGLGSRPPVPRPEPPRAPSAEPAPPGPAPGSAQPGTPPRTAEPLSRSEPPEQDSEARRQEIFSLFQTIKHRDHFDVLGLPPACRRADVEAYFRLARRYHPDTQRDPRLSDLRDEMEAVFIRLGEAYDVLRDQGKRSDYEERVLATAAATDRRSRARGAGGRSCARGRLPGWGGSRRGGGATCRAAVHLGQRGGRRRRSQAEVLGGDPARRAGPSASRRRHAPARTARSRAATSRTPTG